MTNEEAIKWLDNLINDIGHPHHQDLWGYHQALNEIKDIIEQNQWIPCSERLPSRGMPVLVNGIMEGAPPMTISTDAPLYYKNGWINAWRPLPKSYEGEEE